MNTEKNPRKRSADASEEMNTPKRWGFDFPPAAPPPQQQQQQQQQQHFQNDPNYFMFQQQAFPEYQAFFQGPPPGVPMNNPVTPPYSSYIMTPSTGSENSYCNVSDSSGYQTSPTENEDKENKSPCSSQDAKGATVIEKVPGRLALVGNLTKYDVTADEIRRRVNMPECMNSSSLGGLLRRAKVKSGGMDMREQLKEHGIEIAVCKRKGCATTTFTCLTEGEALAMASDMDHIAKVSYPVYPLACNVMTRLAAAGIDTHTAQRDLQGFVNTMQLLSSVLNECTPPVSNHKGIYSVDPNLNQGMTNFSLQTHGFGVENQRTWARQFTNIATQALKLAVPQHPF